MNAIETTPLIAQQHDHNNNNNRPNNDDVDGKKESAAAAADISDPEKAIEDDEEPTTVKDRTHLAIFLTALGAGVFSYFLFMLLYPLLHRVIIFLLSFIVETSKKKSPGDRGDKDYAMDPLSFGIMMFFA